jgi:hypothetical protein
MPSRAPETRGWRKLALLVPELRVMLVGCPPGHSVHLKLRTELVRPVPPGGCCELANHLLNRNEEDRKMPIDGRVLNSWKEVANYIGRGVRTVQRWERHFQLPVHRPSGHDRSAVVAFSDEIDQWLAATPVRVMRPVARNAGLPPRTRQLAEMVQATATTLIRSAEKLQSSMVLAHARQERPAKSEKAASRLSGQRRTTLKNSPS